MHAARFAAAVIATAAAVVTAAAPALADANSRPSVQTPPMPVAQMPQLPQVAAASVPVATLPPLPPLPANAQAARQPADVGTGTKPNRKDRNKQGMTAPEAAAAPQVAAPQIAAPQLLVLSPGTVTSSAELLAQLQAVDAAVVDPVEQDAMLVPPQAATQPSQGLPLGVLVGVGIAGMLAWYALTVWRVRRENRVSPSAA